MQVEGVQSGPVYQPPEVTFGADSEETHQTEQKAPASPEEDAASIIQFREDKISGKMMMTLVNSESGEVVRQIPPEELIDISRVLGLLFDRVA